MDIGRRRDKKTKRLTKKLDRARLFLSRESAGDDPVTSTPKWIVPHPPGPGPETIRLLRSTWAPLQMSTTVRRPLPGFRHDESRSTGGALIIVEPVPAPTTVRFFWMVTCSV